MTLKYASIIFQQVLLFCFFARYQDHESENKAENIARTQPQATRNGTWRVPFWLRTSSGTTQQGEK